MTDDITRFMQEAVKLAFEGMTNNLGGPFGAVIVKNGQIVGRGCNQVSSSHDPTAHAEIVAIRDACTYLNTFQLDDCMIFTSCEPCPMCLGAIYWARIQHIFYACSRQDAAQAGFDDSFIYEEVSLPHTARSIPIQQTDPAEALKVFEAWVNKSDKTVY
jgi:tRNA(Arg) A34 adenosine deaminase TadA